ncbi:hypothetical protein ACFVUS_19375 [Nocardia sp. NPDC058058]|uniref:hypothetical protein n=1 Tax=Nocardia sp. NPDC058058 TaxID=3346317 RepID=UPI0036DEA44F
MTSVVGHPASILGCIALALVVAPESAARRRFAQIFRRDGRFRLPRHVTAGRLAAVAAFPVVFFVGVGTLVAGGLVLGTLVLRRRRTRSDRERAAESAQLLEGLEAVIGELRIGAHPSAAAEVAAVETTGPMARVSRSVPRGVGSADPARMRSGAPRPLYRRNCPGSRMRGRSRIGMVWRWPNCSRRLGWTYWAADVFAIEPQLLWPEPVPRRRYWHYFRSSG